MAVTPAVAERYRDGPVAGWREVVFDGHTRYGPAGDCVRARSQDAASGLIQRVEASLAQTPWLHWQWRAAAPLQGGSAASERSKQGDDFLARVYVIREGFFPWQTRAINYVWARAEPVGASWPNPFADNARMVVVQSGGEGLGEWQAFRRNIAEDFRRYHGETVEQVDAVAVMTDTDNTGGEAEACYRLPEFRSSDAGPSASE